MSYDRVKQVENQLATGVCQQVAKIGLCVLVNYLMSFLL